MTNTYRYNYKCMACGLHYQTYSWNEDWHNEHKPFCPECGKQKSFPLGLERLEGREIYEFVGAK